MLVTLGRLYTGKPVSVEDSEPAQLVGTAVCVDITVEVERDAMVVYLRC